MSRTGKILLPADLRKQDGIVPGQRFEIERIQVGTYLLTTRRGLNHVGIVDWLLACPEKGYLEPIPSESTDSL